MIGSIMFSQVAFKIIKLPEDNGNTDIFMASNLNIWNSSDAQFKFNKSGKVLKEKNIQPTLRSEY